MDSINSPIKLYSATRNTGSDSVYSWYENFSHQHDNILVGGKNMDSKRIKVLMKAVDAGSMMHIAEDLGYTPSGLTHMMTALEQDLGVRLITRNNRGIELTREGQALMPLFNKYIQAEESIRTEIQKLKAERESILRIGAYASIAKHWLSGIMGAFNRAHPEVSIELTTLGNPEAYQMLEKGAIDVAFASYKDNSGFVFTPLKKDPYYAVLPPDSIDPSNYPTFPIKELENYFFIMPSGGADSDAKKVFDANDVHPKLFAAVADDPVIISMVANGTSVSMLSELVLRGNQDNVITIPISPSVYRELGMITRPSKELSAISREFVSYIKKIEF